MEKGIDPKIVRSVGFFIQTHRELDRHFRFSLVMTNLLTFRLNLPLNVLARKSSVMDAWQSPKYTFNSFMTEVPII